MTLLTALVFGFAAILARLVELQVRDGPTYRTLAMGQRLRTIDLPAGRGSILDRNGGELAMSLPARAVYVRPAEVVDVAEEARVVARVLDLPYRQVRAAMGSESPFAYLARGVEVTTAAELEARKLPGVGILPETKRHYPGRELAAQVLGFVGIDGDGLAGVEQQHQELLAGLPGRLVMEADPQGIGIPQGRSLDLPPVAGHDLVLTIDRQIQFRAQSALASTVEANDAKGGSIIVMDPRTGEILAMSDYPSFDPNHVTADTSQHVRNRAVTDAYEPGSVNKVITAAAAVEEGAVSLNQRLMVPYSYRLFSKTFHDSHLHPTEAMTLADILAYSSNIGAIKVAARLGEETLFAYLDRFGLTQKPGMGFPGEADGILDPPSKWSGTSMGTIPIGQGIAVTPLQMAAVYSTIANAGTWVQPRVVRGSVGPDGEFHPAPAPDTRQVVSADTARVLTQMLAYAVEVGTGQSAQIPRYWVAGKTGTARKVNQEGTGYLPGKYVASFIGFVPAARPSLVVAAVLDEPATVYGALSAAPLFRDVARFSLHRLGIAPAPRPQVPPHAIRPTE